MKDNILKAIAPCGLNCKKCLNNQDGEIKLIALKLQNLLGSFDKYAERFSGFRPIFKKYPDFKEFLGFLTTASCNGCRNGGCKYPNCGVYNCHKDKNIDFCFQCNEFPCNKTNFNNDLKERWQTINQRILKVGIENYIEETKDNPRYQ